MSITDPTQLVADGEYRIGDTRFKKSGEFDRLRRELLSLFRNHDSIGTFTSRVSDIIQQRLAEDERLQYLPPEMVHNELMQDMDRFPLVQRTVADLPSLTDPSFNISIRRSLASLLKDGPGAVGDKKTTADGDVDMDSSSGSDSESEDSENEHDPEHEHELDDSDMPQNTRVRVSRTSDSDKHKPNGIDIDEPPGVHDRSPLSSAVNHSRTRQET